MKPLTKADMYKKDALTGKTICILPREILKKHRDRSKYIPAIEDKKHQEAKK